MDALKAAIPSPCTGICRIGGDGRCDGCGRTLNEIARWTGMNAAERHAVMVRLAAVPIGRSVS